MDRMNSMPEVEIYAVTDGEVDRVAELMTGEAVELIKAGAAFGIAIAEENEVRGALCARLASENELCLEIISIFVAPEFRRRGLGITMLLETIEGIFAETGGELMYVSAIFAVFHGERRGRGNVGASGGRCRSFGEASAGYGSGNSDR